MLFDIVLRALKIWSKSFWLIHIYMGIIGTKSYINTFKFTYDHFENVKSKKMNKSCVNWQLE